MSQPQQNLRIIGGRERVGIPSKKKKRGPKRSNAGQADSGAKVSCRNLQKIFTCAACFRNVSLTSRRPTGRLMSIHSEPG